MNQYKAKTYGVRVGCGKLYITIEFNADQSIHKVKLQRNSKFRCPLTVRDALSRQATYQARRDPKQLIKDLKGSENHHCPSYNIVVKAEIKKGGLGGYSCQDAVARVIEKVINEKET